MFLHCRSKAIAVLRFPTLTWIKPNWGQKDHGNAHSHVCPTFASSSQAPEAKRLFEISKEDFYCPSGSRESPALSQSLKFQSWHRRQTALRHWFDCRQQLFWAAEEDLWEIGFFHKKPYHVFLCAFGTLFVQDVVGLAFNSLVMAWDMLGIFFPSQKSIAYWKSFMCFQINN